MEQKIEEILLQCGLSKEDLESDDYNRDEIIDSMTIAEIIIEIEESFQIEIDGENIIPENFMNIKSIMELVLKSGGKL